MSTKPTFEQAGYKWLASLATTIRRNGRPLSANTRRIYAGDLARLIDYMGSEPLPVTNRVLRDYVARMRSENYSASQITGDLAVVKLVCESIRDDNGDCVYPLKINHDFVATPIVNPEEQSAPVATRADIERALAIPGPIAGIVAVAAGAGLRISEILALNFGDVDGSDDAWSPDVAAIYVRRTLKTPAAARTVFIIGDLNRFLLEWARVIVRPMIGGPMFPISKSEVYRLLERHKLPPCHSYRRFYATHRDEKGMNDQILKSLLGHRKRNDVTDRYKHTAARIEFVRAEVERVGLGFALPTVQHSKQPDPKLDLAEVSA